MPDATKQPIISPDTATSTPTDAGTGANSDSDAGTDTNSERDADVTVPVPDQEEYVMLPLPLPDWTSLAEDGVTDEKQNKDSDPESEPEPVVDWPKLRESFDCFILAVLLHRGATSGKTLKSITASVLPGPKSGTRPPDATVYGSLQRLEGDIIEVVDASGSSKQYGVVDERAVMRRVREGMQQHLVLALIYHRSRSAVAAYQDSE